MYIKDVHAWILGENYGAPGLHCVLAIYIRKYLYKLQNTQELHVQHNKNKSNQPIHPVAEEDQNN